MFTKSFPRYRSFSLAMVCAAGLITSAAGATTIPLTNPGFETGSFGTAWFTSGSDVTVQPTTIPGGGSYNAQIANDGTEDGLGQASTAIQAGTYTYTADLSVDSAAATAGYLAILAIGTSTQLQAFTYSAHTMVSSSLAAGQYTLESVTWDVAPGNSAIGQDIAIGFADSGRGGTGGNMYFDNAGLSFTAVPEPASLGVFAIGGVSLVLVGRKRRRREL